MDTKTSIEVMAIFQELQRSGITVILVTHEPDIAAFTERVLVMRDGQVQTDGRHAASLASPATGALAEVHV